MIFMQFHQHSSGKKKHSGKAHYSSNNGPYRRFGKEHAYAGEENRQDKRQNGKPKPESGPDQNLQSPGIKPQLLRKPFSTVCILIVIPKIFRDTPERAAEHSVFSAQ